MTIDLDRVLFTWPDGRFGYQCRGCGACCKGLGIGLDVAGGQLAALVERRPAIAPWVRRRGAALTVWNPRDRCWFFDDDGQCRIEREDGRDAKPASCRLFPFNRVFRLGSWTVVDYNSVICPLAAGGHGGVTHAEIAAEIDGITDDALVGTALVGGLAASDAEREGRALVERERAIATACFAAADEADRDAAIATAWAAQSPAALASVRASVDGALLAITGTGWRAPPTATLAAALWLTPSLRFNELYGPRQYAPRPAMVDALPAMWLAWLGLGAGGAALADRALGLQELTTCWSEQAAVMYLAARWADAPSLKPGPIELPGVDPHGLVRGLAQAAIDNRKTRRPASTVFAPILAAAPLIDRVAAIKSAEPILRAVFAR